MRTQHTVAIIDDEAAQRALLENALQRAGYATLTGETGEDALRHADTCDLILLDVRMPVMTGLEALERLSRTHAGLPVILLTAFIDVRDAVNAIKQGAVDYLEKPVDLDELVVAIDEALGAPGRAIAANELVLPDGVVAESEAMGDVFRQAARVAETEAAVLLLGESGVGKEVVARFIHDNSARAEGALVVVDCTTLPRDLAESVLFGHEQGAFTGADSRHEGRFTEADGGTVFLDELGELPPALQPKLLRVLEAGTFRPVGGTRDLHASVRVIAATNRRLEEEVAAGRFREDLFYRLNVFPIEIPPLRERSDDILPLAESVLRPHHKRLAPAAQRQLLTYDWPGNVREMRNAMERAAILATGDLVLPADLPPALQQARPATKRGGGVLVGDMKEIQRQAILEALEKTGGNKSHAAELLGISRRNLIYKLRAYGM